MKALSKWLLCLVLLATAAPATGAVDLLLTGDGETAWLLARKSDGGFTISLYRPGQQFKVVSEISGGWPTAVAAAGSQLHLFYASGAAPLRHEVASADSPDPSPRLQAPPNAPQWGKNQPAEAACGVVTGTTPSVIVVVRQPAHKESTTSAPAPSTQAEAQAPQMHSLPAVRSSPASRGSASRRIATTSAASSSAAADAVTLSLFQKTGVAWRQIGSLPASLSPGAQLFCASAGGKVYLLIASPSGGGGNQLWMLDADGWEELPLEHQVRLTPAAGLQILRQGVVIVLQPRLGGQRNNMVLAIRQSDGTFALKTLMLNGKPASWPTNSLPSVARVGERPLLVWREGDKTLYSLAQLDGQMNPPAAMDVLKPGEPNGLQDTSMLVATVAIVAVMLMLLLTRPRPARPFALPQGVAPANLLKRLVAALIDLMPFLLAASAIFYPPLLYNPQAVDPAAPPAEVSYGMFLGLLAYVAYCGIMEARFGATIGKRLLGLKAVGEDAAPLTVRQAVLRNLFKVVELPYPIIFAALMPVLLSRYRRRFGDMVARTAIVEAATLGAPRPPQNPQDSNRSQPPTDSSAS